MRKPVRLLARMNALVAEHAALKPEVQERGEWFNITAPRAEGAATEIYMYGEVGGWYGATAGEFVDALRAVPAGAIDLHVNSPGGDIFEGAAIHTALAAHKGPVTAYVDGLAASAASFIVMAADRIVMAPMATMMVHDGLCLTIGNEADHLLSAELLGKLSDTIAASYARRTGGETAAWRNVMRAETWYNAEEAVAAGLADEISGEPDPDEQVGTPAMKMRATFDLSIFNYAGRDRAPAPRAPQPAAELLCKCMNLDGKCPNKHYADTLPDEPPDISPSALDGADEYTSQLSRALLAEALGRG
jgi:ATP-dependent protease ClpP protease subunit